MLVSSFLLSSLILSISVVFCLTAENRLPIVYVYTVVPAVCKHGLPDYIKISLEQAIFTQPDCDVILVSNFNECTVIRDSVKDVHNLLLVDSTLIASDRTRDFHNASASIFQSDGYNELWMTSALRFFIMEDLFYAHNYVEMMHIEADNLLYGRYTSILPILRTGYKGLAATPLNANKSFITASVLWISSLEAIIKFNNYMLELARNTDGRWRGYLNWLRPYACCRPGGIDADESGKGIKPFAVNEMSMLAYYHELYPSDFKLLPVVPAFEYVTNKYVCNMSDFGPGGREAGPATGHGVWDPNSWGQYMGGTSSKRGRDIGFTDPSHVAGQAMRLSKCISEMVCGNQTVSPYGFTEKDYTVTAAISGTNTNTNSDTDNSIGRITYDIDGRRRILNQYHVGHNKNSSHSGRHGGHGGHKHNRFGRFNKHGNYTIHTTVTQTKAANSSETLCYTAPFIRCGGIANEWLNLTESPWIPLWNLHVHSKHTQKFRSIPCDCPVV